MSRRWLQSWRSERNTTGFVRKVKGRRLRRSRFSRVTSGCEAEQFARRCHRSIRLYLLDPACARQVPPRRSVFSMAFLWWRICALSRKKTCDSARVCAWDEYRNLCFRRGRRYAHGGPRLPDSDWISCRSSRFLLGLTQLQSKRSGQPAEQRGFYGRFVDQILSEPRVAALVSLTKRIPE